MICFHCFLLVCRRPRKPRSGSKSAAVALTRVGTFWNVSWNVSKSLFVLCGFYFIIWVAFAGFLIVGLVLTDFGNVFVASFWRVASHDFQGAQPVQVPRSPWQVSPNVTKHPRPIWVFSLLTLKPKKNKIWNVVVSLLAGFTSLHTSRRMLMPSWSSSPWAQTKLWWRSPDSSKRCPDCTKPLLRTSNTLDSWKEPTNHDTNPPWGEAPKQGVLRYTNLLTFQKAPPKATAKNVLPFCPRFWASAKRGPACRQPSIKEKDQKRPEYPKICFRFIFGSGFVDFLSGTKQTRK